MGRHLINLYSSGIRTVLKIDDIAQLRRDIAEDPIIKDSKADISILMVTTFGKWLSPILIACHTLKHTKYMTAKTTKQEELEEE